jgi:hypothetical protein
MKMACSGGLTRLSLFGERIDENRDILTCK